jgi:hypothetical protein
MASYEQISRWVKREYWFSPKPCWIAHVKADCGLPVRVAHNRRNPSIREVPCPPEKRPAILAALRHFKMI